MAVNSPIQGSAADLIKVAMINVHRALKQKLPDVRMILQVHDELIFEGPRAEMETVREMCLRLMPQSIEMVVPLKVDIKTGTNWGELEVARGPLVGEEEAFEFAESA